MTPSGSTWPGKNVRPQRHSFVGEPVERADADRFALPEWLENSLNSAKRRRICSGWDFCVVCSCELPRRSPALRDQFRNQANFMRNRCSPISVHVAPCFRADVNSNSIGASAANRKMLVRAEHHLPLLCCDVPSCILKIDELCLSA